MATKQGRKFGDDKPVQRNKESNGLGKPNRSPGQSNAAKPLPSLKEDVVKSVKADAKRIGKGLSPSGKSALTRSAQQLAGGRALTRMAGRVVPALGALEGGYQAGRMIDEKTGIGKKLVDKVFGKAIDQYISGGTGERVQLTKESKDRLAKMKKDEQTAKQKSRSETRMSDVKAKDAPSKKESGPNFSQAFAAARREGKSTFSWNGKSYSSRKDTETSAQHKEFLAKKKK